MAVLDALCSIKLLPSPAAMCQRGVLLPDTFIVPSTYGGAAETPYHP